MSRARNNGGLETAAKLTIKSRPVNRQIGMPALLDKGFIHPPFGG
jgi:hypothetical protein